MSPSRLLVSVSQTLQKKLKAQQNLFNPPTLYASIQFLTLYPGHGIQFVRNDAKAIEWKGQEKLGGASLFSFCFPCLKDSTFEFERKRNTPERYYRNLTENTLKAIKKIDKIRVAREERLHSKRMVGKKSKERKEAAVELEQASTCSKLHLFFHRTNL
ncbi:hypothetical protein Ddye_008161 [Dipteronia dyeriana]|uniref:Uncharacterized protein n=1 Tax=Dipteronia dyeriana TaxID=168575 RepID=A0AAD9X949_9ROSI|nr:hypothetical protein Ddye_008161 [Dipteronia dyeriana]